MKKYYLLFLFFGLLSNAQIVTIPDINFKNALLDYTPVIDSNNNDEIEVSEALNVTSLAFFSLNTTNTTGLEAFTNLNSLTLTNHTYLTTLDLTGLVNLQYLDCSLNTNLASLDISNLPNLQIVDCSRCTALTELNLSGSTNLTTLLCHQGNLSTLDLSSQTNLQTLNCANNYSLNTLNVNGLTNLQNLNCSDNHFLTTLDLSNLTSIQIVNCYRSSLTSITTTGANNITHFDCSTNYLTSLHVSEMSNLQVLNCQNNNRSSTSGLTSLDVTNLTNLTQLNCGTNLITDLDVSQLINLTSLSCNNNLLSSIMVTPLTNLIFFYCGNNQISSLDVSTLINLKEFSCNNNLLTSINVNNLSNLESLNVSSNPINTLDITNLNDLLYLYCEANNLSSLDISNQTDLRTLYCINNQLTEIDLSNAPFLRYIFLSNNLFTTVDLSHLISYQGSGQQVLYQIYLDNIPNLEFVNFKNELSGFNEYGYFMFDVSNSNNLDFVCTDENNILFLQEHIQNYSGSNANVNSYCSFVPSGIHNTISGTATIDSNNNGCDTSDYQPNDLKITINDGTTSGATFSNNGDYAFYTQTGSFTLTPQFENPYFTVSPAIATLNFDTLDGSTQIQNFCITPNGIHNDVDVTLLPIIPARPGFDAVYQLIYKNKGNQTLSGTVNFSFDDAILDFVSASPIVDSQVMNVLSWNYSNLLPFESRTINFTLNVNAPTETPPVNNGDELNLVVMIEPIVNDETQNDNAFNLNQIVVGSYDPNDKTCLEGDLISTAKVGDYLHYLIRFQNSGTAPAENIVVKDLIDNTKFDLTSLQLTASSHPQVTRITGNKVEFIFEGIQLPAEQDNEPASHGYIAFKIKTKNNLVIGNTISNTANIYFDYNFPIVTNTATTAIVALGVDEFENTTVVITPNPVKDILTIAADDVITSIQMYDVQGRLITTQLNNAATFNLDMSQQILGIYFVKVITENGVKVEKIIKE